MKFENFPSLLGILSLPKLCHRILIKSEQMIGTKKKINYGILIIPSQVFIMWISVWNTSLRWTGIEINRKICEKYDQRHSVALIIFNYGYKKEKKNRLSCSISVKSRR